MYQDGAVRGPVLWVAVWGARSSSSPESEGVGMRVLVARDHGCIGAVLVSYLHAGQEVCGK
jgi:hypothetical protein